MAQCGALFAGQFEVQTLVPHSGGRGAFSYFTKHWQIGIRVSPILEQLSVGIRSSLLVAGGAASTSESEQCPAPVRGELQCLLVGSGGLGRPPGLDASFT